MVLQNFTGIQFACRCADRVVGNADRRGSFDVDHVVADSGAGVRVVLRSKRVEQGICEGIWWCSTRELGELQRGFQRGGPTA